jgi:hypothetical protein
MCKRAAMAWYWFLGKDTAPLSGNKAASIWNVIIQLQSQWSWLQPSDATGSTQIVSAFFSACVTIRRKSAQRDTAWNVFTPRIRFVGDTGSRIRSLVVHSLLYPTFYLICNAAVCICGFCMVATLNSLKHHQPADLCNGKVWCFLWGTDWILK